MTATVISCAVAGLVIGSFLTVVITRVPGGGSVVTPPSRCDRCGTRLTTADLVPLASWLSSRGTCRHCGAPIGAEPLLVELTTAGLFVALAVEFGPDPALPAFCVLAAALVALVWIDVRHFRLPREITYTAFALGTLGLTIAALVEGEPARITRAFLGAGISLAVMGAIYLASRGGLGDGDVRLAPLLGLYLGYLDPGIVPIGLFLGFLLGAVVGVAVLLSGHGDRKTALPFGPFLAAGTLAAVFVGEPLLDRVW